MAGLLLFVLGIALGLTVSPWCFFICLIPVAATITDAWASTPSYTSLYTRPRKARSRGRPKK